MKRFSLFALLLFAAGCRPADDQVRTYTQPKTQAAATPEKVAPPAAGSPVRTLAVIVPVEDKYSRFVKLNAPAEAVDAVEPQFLAFAKSLQVTAGPEHALEFQLPEGWAKLPDRQMRQVTFQAGKSGQKVEPYISGVFGGDVLANVNRWRKEVGLSEIAADQLAGSSKPLEGGPPGAILVDLRGTATGSGMSGMTRGPFQK